MSQSSLAHSSAVMAAGTVASRVLGFGRTVALGWILGVGVVADTFNVANTLPNSFYLLLAGGVLNAVLVPQITKAAAHGDGGHTYVNRLLTLSFTVLVGATVFVTALGAVLVRIFASSKWDEQALTLATAFALLCLPQLFFYGLYTVLGQVLNARQHFGAYMWAPAAANVVQIAGILYFRFAFGTQVPISQWTPAMVAVLGGTATLGVAVQALCLVPPLRRIGFRYRPVWGFRGAGLRSASTVALWTFAAVGVSQLGFIVTTRVLTGAGSLLQDAHEVGAGSFAYGAAFLLFMLPHSLVTVSLVTALFTRISNSVHTGDRAEVLGDFHRGLRLPAVFLVPATVAGIVLGAPAVRVAFAGNSVDETNAIAGVMVTMMLGLVPYGWLYLIQRVYYAYENARTPFYLQLVVTVVATVVNLLAALVDPKATGPVVGIGQTLSNLAAVVVGFVLLRRLLGPLRLRDTARLYVRLVIAAVFAGVLAFAAASGLAALLPHTASGQLSWAATVVQLVVGGVVLVAAYLALAHVMHVREVGQVLDPLLRRVRPRRSFAGD